jgi:hypothetical protein
MIKRLVGFIIAILVLVAGEIYCFSTTRNQPLEPRNFTYSDFTEKFFIVFFLFLLACFLFQWNANKLTDTFYDEQYSIPMKIYFLVTYIIFTFIVPAYIIGRMIYYVFGGMMAIGEAIMVSYLFTSIVMIVRRVIYD